MPPRKPYFRKHRKRNTKHANSDKKIILNQVKPGEKFNSKKHEERRNRQFGVMVKPSGNEKKRRFFVSKNELDLLIKHNQNLPELAGSNKGKYPYGFVDRRKKTHKYQKTKTFKSGGQRKNKPAKKK